MDENWASIICGAIAVIGTIICAIIASKSAKREKEIKDQNEKAEERSKQRAEEGRLMLAMISANIKLTVGVAMALKHGHANGEVEEGLKAVEEANTAYTKFLEDIAIDHLTK